MKPITSRIVILFTFLLFTFSVYLEPAHTQTLPPSRGVLRLKVRYKSGNATKELPRKRFFLIKGSLADNKLLVERIKANQTISRECYYRAKRASEAFVRWLKENDCDSVYCRPIDERYVTGSDAVPEFQAAYNEGLRQFKSPELARRWLTVNLAPELRIDFYNEKQKMIDALLAESRTNVVSVMTDRHGSAYVTDIEPGVYTISNLIASETEKTSILWTCETEVKAVNLAIAIRRFVTLSNENDPKVKCEIVERPLPVCEPTTK